MDEQRLIEEHLDLVRTIASKIAGRTATDADFDDLVAFGRQGLVQAARRYDPDKGASFSTYAYYRIRGAIFDGMRAIGRGGPRDRRRAFEERADAYLEQVGKEPEPPTAVAAAERLASVVADLAVVFVATSEQIDQAPDTTTPDPAEVAEQKELLDKIRQGMSRLPKAERELLDAVYFRGKGLVAAGEELGHSKGWASRLHARALSRLRRESMEEDRPDDPPPPHAIRV